MRELLRSADCFAFPTRGEGFGLPPLEAMASGLPTILTNWSGPVDYSDPDDTVLLSYRMERSAEFDAIYKDFVEPGEDSGQWAEPSLEDLRAKMRWCFEHRAKAKAMGQAAAARISREWTWQRQAQALIRIIKSDHINTLNPGPR